MSPPVLRFFLLAFTFVAATRAHDLYTSWTDATLRDDRLLLTLTLSRANALRLLPDSASLPPIVPENFPTYTPKLKTVAPGLFAISAGTTQLKFISATASISGDDDITFQLVYTWQREIAGKLRVVAHYLRHLVDGHVGTIVLMDPAGKDLGWSPVTVEQPVFETPLPKPAGSP